MRFLCAALGAADLDLAVLEAGVEARLRRSGWSFDDRTVEAEGAAVAGAGDGVAGELAFVKIAAAV
jgi:hypothetical protein